MFKPDNISTPIPFNANVSDAVALAEGDEAADRVLQRSQLGRPPEDRTGPDGWCSRLAAKEAGTDQGKPYALA